MTGRVVLVTGAAGGIGLACTRVLLEDGYRVMAADVDASRLRGALTDGDPQMLASVAADVSQAAECELAVRMTIERFGQLDALIHWAAIHSTARWNELSGDECSRVMITNVTGAHLAAQAAARAMIERGGGSIVLCTSASVCYGITGGDGQGGPAYVASKSAIIGLMRSLARSLAPHNVRVNAVSPGLTETPLIAEYTAEKRAAMLKRLVVGRFGRPEEIAHAAVYLISDRASFMTGSIMHVNGGSDFA
jgi:NAD(P)-dependent dehydrogenase (short-subunit alcohol dehydrogenase family)